jgi:hypothetical protein
LLREAQTQLDRAGIGELASMPAGTLALASNPSWKLPARWPLSDLLGSAREQNETFPIIHGRGDGRRTRPGVILGPGRGREGGT